MARSRDLKSVVRKDVRVRLPPSAPVATLATPDTSEHHSSNEKVEALVEIICRADDEPETKSAALLVLMAALENSKHPKALANTAKHLVFTRCGELNPFGMIEAQVTTVDPELLLSVV